MKLFLTLDETRDLKEHGSVEIIRDGMEIVVEGDPAWYTITVVNPYEEVVLAKEPAKKVEETPAKKEIVVNLTVLNMLKKKLAKTLPFMVEDACEEYREMDELPTLEDIKDNIGEMMNTFMYEDDFMKAFDFVAKHDGVDIKKNDSADYVWSKYEYEMDFILRETAKEAYDKLISVDLNK